MTTLSKTIYITFGILILLTVMRETGVVNLNYYRSDINYSENIEWFNGSSQTSDSTSTDLPKYVNTDISIIILQENDTLFKEIHKLAPLVITIETFQTGPLWTPLYKSVTFSASGFPGFEHKPEDDLPGPLKSTIGGKLKITGTAKITGFCSHRHAVQVIKDFVVNRFAENTRKHLTTEKSSYTNALPLYKKRSS